MIWKFTLSNDTLGDIVISEPDGWQQCKMRLERHNDFHSLVEYFEGSFIFYGDTGNGNGGADFIKAVEDIGINEYLGIKIEVTYDNITWIEAFEGQLALDQIEEVNDNKIRVPIIRDDFWSKFINRLDTPVDLQAAIGIDGTTVTQYDPIAVHLTNQTLRKRYEGDFLDGTRVLTDGAGGYLQFSPDDIKIEEIETFFNLPTAWNADVPVYILECSEAGSYTFDIQISISGIADAGIDPGDPTFFVLHDILTGNPFWEFLIQKNDETPIVFADDFVETGTGGRGYSFFNTVATFNLNVNDTIRIYAHELSNVRTVLGFWGINGTAYITNGPDPQPAIWPNITTFDVPSYFKVHAETVYPDSNAIGFLLHDAGCLITDRIIGRNQTLYSEILGSDLTTTRVYDNNGCHWATAVVRGLQIRQYNIYDKPFQMSFNQWWKGADPILSLGLGYELIDDEQVFRVEDKEYFYDDSDTSINFDYCRGDGLARSHDDNMVFKKINVGYSQWQAEEISGIDDPQTKHTYASIFRITGKELTLYSDFIAASQVIEFTRRKTIEKTADYKFDNNTFVIALNPVPYDVPQPVPATYNVFLPELSENFTSVTNLFNANERYNLRFTPARNLLRWIKFISGCLQQYLLSAFSFQSGEGNYDVVSTMDAANCDKADYDGNPLSEKQSIGASNDPLKRDDYQRGIQVRMSMDQYKMVLANRRKPIGISQSNVNHKRLFIDVLDYQPVQGFATISGWWRDKFTMTNEGSVSQPICYGRFDAPCGDDAILSEGGDYLITEDGECIIME